MKKINVICRIFEPGGMLIKTEDNEMVPKEKGGLELKNPILMDGGGMVMIEIPAPQEGLRELVHIHRSK